VIQILGAGDIVDKVEDVLSRNDVYTSPVSTQLCDWTIIVPDGVSDVVPITETIEWLRKGDTRIVIVGDEFPSFGDVYFVRSKDIDEAFTSIASFMKATDQESRQAALAGIIANFWVYDAKTVQR
jgi:hypothetical protein